MADTKASDYLSDQRRIGLGIEADANLHAPIVTKALSDEHMDSPINGLGSTQDDPTEDDADLEGMDTEWDEFW
ncbi:uncharacterized protein F5147DRAFT_777563 [Suillus discolor]|uniref:AdoMet activation domain-containing protein n=1 Tax=Suillus discolor TaxID=1912936 RepID=A0A9P7F0Q2_9AGAM|nr:uncharacterized protein F5147DRAFT_777563 [Suillus discolor]KAG2098719.1 hypothetical protein F5147DRAFT_777563 [Suillus discolor]